MKYRKSEYVDTPHGNFSVWRYMAHWKFQELLNNSELFFTNAAKLSDQHEVTIPKSVLKSKRKELQDAGLKGKDLEDELAAFHWETNPMKELVLVNCWSISSYESYALWKIYLGGEKNGVAIRSTVGSLRRAVEKGSDSYPEEFFVGKVKYRAHLRSDELARLSVITTKKPYYKFEDELRLFILNYPLSEGGTRPPYDIKSGRTVKVDLESALKQVYVSPFAGPDYSQEIRNLLRSRGLTTKIMKHSDIRDK